MEQVFHWLPLTSQALLSQDHTAWYKFQSLLALVRMLGGGATLAWTLQLALTAITASVLCVMWCNTRIAFELKAAAAAAAVPLATPYVYLYDLTVPGGVCGLSWSAAHSPPVLCRAKPSASRQLRRCF